MTERNCPVSYTIKSGSFTKKELRENDMGGCDGLIIHSLMFPKDGSRSEIIVSFGPDGKELPILEVWKSWVNMAYTLMNDPNLSQPKRDLCKLLFDHVKECLKKSMLE